MKKFNRISFMVLFILSIAYSQQDLFNLVLLSQERGASCLDGSPPGIYVHEGQGQNKNNFLIYFEGGGYCGQPTLAETLQSCYSRSFTDLGSSTKYPPTMSGKTLGAVSPLKQQNPLFYDWTLIIPKYCDGHEYIGHRQNPVQFKNRNLYFRGSRNVKEIFHYLSEKYDFYNGGKIAIAGGSAGGICAYQWANYLADQTKSAKIFAHPDSGFFITDYFSPLANKKIIRAQVGPLMNLVYNQQQTPEPVAKCLQNPNFDIVDCLNVANYAQYIKVPLFIVETPYDQYSLRHIVGTNCLTNKDDPYSLQSCDSVQRAAIEDYRLRSIEYLKAMRNGRKDVGIWGPACVQHSFQHVTQCYNNQNYQVNGTTLMQALEIFFNNPDQAPWLLDERPWPENVGCNGLHNLTFE